MRLLPTLLLVCVLIPISHQSTAADSMRSAPLCQRLCASTLTDIDHATELGDATLLMGMLYPGGISVKSSDGSISRASLAQAANAWNSALGRKIFRPAGAGEKATVDSKLVRKIEVQDDLQGLVAAVTDEYGHVTAKILVSSSNGKQQLTDSEVGSVVTHEFGHLLGLDDAPAGVPSGRYIMDAFDPNHVVLTPAPSEVAAVEGLRVKIRDAIRSVEVVAEESDQTEG